MIFISLSDAIDKKKTDPDVGLFTFLLIETFSMGNVNSSHTYVHARRLQNDNQQRAALRVFSWDSLLSVTQ